MEPAKGLEPLTSGLRRRRITVFGCPCLSVLMMTSAANFTTCSKLAGPGYHFLRRFLMVRRGLGGTRSRSCRRLQRTPGPHCPPGNCFRKCPNVDAKPSPARV